VRRVVISCVGLYCHDSFVFVHLRWIYFALLHTRVPRLSVVSLRFCLLDLNEQEIFTRVITGLALSGQEEQSRTHMLAHNNCMIGTEL
jgi:hypothetical protein